MSSPDLSDHLILFNYFFIEIEKVLVPSLYSKFILPGIACQV